MPTNRAAERYHEAVEEELNQERAAVLGRAGRRVEVAIARCEVLGTGADPDDLDAYRAERQVMRRAIADLCIQREMLGLVDHSRIHATYRVPPPR